MAEWTQDLDMQLIEAVAGGASYASASEALGISASAARGRHHRMRQRFDDLISGGDDSDKAVSPAFAAEQLGLPSRAGEILLGIIERELGPQSA